MQRSILLISLLVYIALTGCKQHTESHEEQTKFLISSPLKKDTTVFREYVCQIRAIQHIELRALEKGYLQNIYVDEGQVVKKGQLMFQIMPLIYQAEMQKAQAEVSYAELEYLNTKSLADSNIVSKNELALAKAHLDKTKAELALAQAHLGFTEIRAPFDGIMGRFNVRLGSLVDEGELLTTLSDNSKMWTYFNVPESEYLDYKQKAKTEKLPQVLLQLANKQMFDSKGTIETIEADFNNETGNIAFRATFINPNALLRHGETGNILMPVFIKDAIIIPQKACFEILDKKYVYLVDAENRVHSQLITVAEEMPHLYVVSSGLKPSDKILIDGLRKVKNNDEIHPEFVNFNEVVDELHQLHAE